MPRHDWYGDDYMTRERDYRDLGDRERRGYNSGSGAFFGSDREDRGRRSLLRDESSGGRDSDTRFDRERRDYGPDDSRSEIPRDETERLIASNKVEGTPVYDMGGERLGSIHNFMVDKFRGKVVYAVLKHGSGFLGLDDRYYPLDWDQLTFDTRLGGYRLQMTEDDLKRSGSWDRNERWRSRMGPERDRQPPRRERDYRPDYERGAMREPW